MIAKVYSVIVNIAERPAAAVRSLPYAGPAAREASYWSSHSELLYLRYRRCKGGRHGALEDVQANAGHELRSSREPFVLWRVRHTAIRPERGASWLVVCQGRAVRHGAATCRGTVL